MGADEKHAATYHGGKYTPSELALITAWCDQRRNLLEYNNQPPEGIVERTEQAQRTLAKVRAEAKAEALNEVADEWERLMKIGKQMFAETTREDNAAFDDWAGQEKPGWLRARANQYKENQ